MGHYLGQQIYVNGSVGHLCKSITLIQFQPRFNLTFINLLVHHNYLILHY